MTQRRLVVRRLTAAVIVTLAAAVLWLLGRSSEVAAGSTVPAREEAPPPAHADRWAHAAAPPSWRDDAGVEITTAPEPPGPCSTIRTVAWGGRPIADALVLVRTWPGREHDGSPLARELRTDARGEASLCLPAERAVSLGAWDDEGRATQRSGVWSARVGETLTLHLVEPAAIAGTVTDTFGRPLAGASLFLERYRPDGEGGAVQPGSGDYNLGITGEPVWRSDVEGRFEIPLERMVLVQVRAEAPGHRHTAAGPVAARPGERVEVALELAPGAVLRGTVLDEGGPVGGVSISLSAGWIERDARTDDEGRFAIDGLDPGGLYDVTLTSDEHLPLQATLAPGDHSFDLVRGGRVEVTVTASEAAAACGPISVGVSAPSGRWRSVSGVIGQPIDVRAVDEGEVMIEIAALGLYVQRRVEVRRAQTSTLTIDLQSPEQALLIVRTSGASVSRAITDANGESAWMQGTDGSACALLDPGHYRVHGGGGEDDDPREIDLAPAEVLTIDLPARAPATPECLPDFTGRRVEGGLLVTGVGAEAEPILPGDRIVRAGDYDEGEGVIGALHGEEGSLVTVHAARPDGSTIQAALRRMRCPRPR